MEKRNRIVMNEWESAIETTRKTGSEEILGLTSKNTLLNFWQWAYSDIIGNTERGCLAEYLVALACNIDQKVRVSWDSYDLELLPERIKIEVKSSAYLQTWKQKGYSKPSFGIPKTKAWDYIENLYHEESKRQADVYVFALLSHKQKETLNPLNTSQWEFYILRTEVIDHEMKDRKQISLEKVKELNALKSTFSELKDNIIGLVQGSL